jgi:3-hydroxyacyl-[acyl-carrier-protein] dehydratase
VRFVLVDRLQELRKAEFVRAEKTFSRDEEFFADHFPGFRVVPGALMLEVMAQSCGWLVAWSLDFEAKSVLVLANHVQFRRFVSPGHKIIVEAKPHAALSSRVAFMAEARVNNHLVARADLSFVVYNLNDDKSPFERKMTSDWLRTRFSELGGLAAAKRGEAAARGKKT